MNITSVNSPDTFSAILWDCHMHSFFSADSDTPMEDMVRQALALGLKGICFTEHLDPDYPQTPDNLEFSLDIPAYHAHLLELKNTFKGQLDIRLASKSDFSLTFENIFTIFYRNIPLILSLLLPSGSWRRPLLSGIFPGKG